MNKVKRNDWVFDLVSGGIWLRHVLSVTNDQIFYYWMSGEKPINNSIPMHVEKYTILNCKTGFKLARLTCWWNR